jgi:hypothetical protein
LSFDRIGASIDWFDPAECQKIRSANWLGLPFGGPENPISTTPVSVLKLAVKLASVTFMLFLSITPTLLSDDVQIHRHSALTSAALGFFVLSIRTNGIMTRHSTPMNQATSMYDSTLAWVVTELYMRKVV